MEKEAIMESYEFYIYNKTNSQTEKMWFTEAQAKQLKTKIKNGYIPFKFSLIEDKERVNKLKPNHKCYNVSITLQTLDELIEFMKTFGVIEISNQEIKLLQVWTPYLNNGDVPDMFGYFDSILD